MAMAIGCLVLLAMESFEAVLGYELRVLIESDRAWKDGAEVPEVHVTLRLGAQMVLSALLPFALVEAAIPEKAEPLV
jgi:hypothetical protein